MKSSGTWTVLPAVVLTCCFTHYALAGPLPMPLVCHLDLADRIVVGKIVKMGSLRGEPGNIARDCTATVEVRETLKGRPVKTVDITVAGWLNRKNAHFMASPPTVRKVGDDGIWLINPPWSLRAGLSSISQRDTFKKLLAELNSRKWSKEVNSLRAWARMVHYPHDRPRGSVLIFAVQNASKKRVMYRALFRGCVLRLSARDERGKVYARLAGAGAGHLINWLDPQQIAYVHPAWSYILPERHLPALPPGKYSLTVTLESKGSAPDLWEGKLSAPPVTLVVPAKKAAAKTQPKTRPTAHPAAKTRPATTRRSSSQAQAGRLDPVRIEALLNDLTSPGHKKWPAAAKELGTLADDEAVDQLITMARSSFLVTMAHTRPRDIRCRAVYALGFVRGRTEKVMPVLVAIAADRTFGYPKTIIGALSRQGVRSKAALPFVIEAVRGHGSWGAEHIHWKGIGPAAVPYLRKELKNPKSRGWATYALSTLGRDARPAMRELIPSLDDSNLHTRASAARALGAIGPEAKDAVVPLLRVLKEKEKEKDGRAASAAAKALGQIGAGTAPVVNGLIAALGEGKRSGIPPTAARALGAIGPPAIAALDPLLAALGNQKSLYLRRAAAEAIGGLGPKAGKALPHLKRTLNDENIEVRCASAFSIWQLTTDATLVLPALLKDLRNVEGLGSDWDRQRAAETLGAIGPKAAPAVPALVEALGDVPSGDDFNLGQDRQAAAIALGRIGPAAKAAAPALRKALSDPRLRVRRAAVEALEKILVEAQPGTLPAKVGEVRTFKAPKPTAFYSVAFSPDGSRVLAGSGRSLYVWQTKTGKQLVSFGEHALRLAVSPDGSLVATCQVNINDEKHVVRLWDLEKGRELRSFKGHQFSATCVAFSPDGRLVASGGGRRGNKGGRVRIWDPKTLREKASFDLKGDVAAVAFSPDGKRIVAAVFTDLTVRLWDIKTAKELRRFKGHRDRVASASMSPDGRFVLSGSWDKTLRLWDARTGKEVRRFEGHTGRVLSAAFSPDGRWILSGGYDKIVRLWDAATGKEAHRFEGHQQWVMGVAFSPDGQFAASASGDGTVRLWRLPGRQKSGPATQPATTRSAAVDSPQAKPATKTEARVGQVNRS